MLRGAEYRNALEGARTGNDRRTLGIGEAIKLIGSLAVASDTPVEAKRDKTPEELLHESWHP
jgi:hypothetical protein